MYAATIKDVAIKKLTELSEVEIAKVLIFMAGLDAGTSINTHINDSQPCEREDSG